VCGYLHFIIQPLTVPPGFLIINSSKWLYSCSFKKNCRYLWHLCVVLQWKPTKNHYILVQFNDSDSNSTITVIFVSINTEINFHCFAVNTELCLW